MKILMSKYNRETFCQREAEGGWRLYGRRDEEFLNLEGDGRSVTMKGSTEMS